MRSGFLSIAACVLLLASNAPASMREVKPDEVPTLNPDEGLLVVDVDTSQPIDAVEIRKDDNLFGGYTVRDVPAGQSELLYVATAGEYRWNCIQYLLAAQTISYSLDEDPEFHFQVKPGVINYPGDLVNRTDGYTQSIIHTVNRGVVAIDWMRAHHRVLYDHFAFVYNGHYIDPFPDFYKNERASAASRTDADLGKTLPPPEPVKLPIPIKNLWPELQIDQFSLSPDGDLLAEVTVDSKTSHLDLIDLKTRTATRLISSRAGVERLDWVGDGTLAASYNDSLAPPDVYIVHIGDTTADGHRNFTRFLVPHSGWAVGTIPNDNDHLLFQIRTRNDDLQVFRIDIAGAEGSPDFQFENSAKLNHGIDGAIDWFTDGAGKLRAAVAKQGEDWTVFYGTPGHYRPVFKLSDFNPMALSADGRLFYGLSDNQRGQTDLVSFDPLTHAFATIYSKPGVDLHAPVFDSQRRIIGASYYRDGVLVVDYFDDADRTISARIAGAFPDSTTLLLDRDDAGRHFVVAVERSDQAPKYYTFDAARSVAALIDESLPGLAGRKLAMARTIAVTGRDGTRIEAYLTMPNNIVGKVPLIVYPHGGPIGVRDTRQFDPSVQLFASMGYAVLQVNFRGSDGYGRLFREAGEKRFGNLIEDDIDAATRTVLKEDPIDPGRLCIVGASYGGYSALVSAIRWPGRFRCTVSISGVTDQQLMFTASDSSQSAEGRREMEKIIGNPVGDGATMRTYSPLYRYKEITIPVMLAHGTEDARVDFEHSRRMIRMLNLAGHPPVMLTLQGEGHGNFDHRNTIKLWSGVAGFLQANLDAHGTTPLPSH
jgi:dipeptidyl aminopeptidase/acylaminoacyl peptidase